MKDKQKQNQKASKLSLKEALEPRIMLDAAAIAAAVTPDTSEAGGVDETAAYLNGESVNPIVDNMENPATPDTDVSDSPDADGKANELIFVDDNVADHETLVEDIFGEDVYENNHYEVIKVSSDADGFQVITDILVERSDISAIHILSHATEGSLQLGEANLSADNLSGYESSLQSWQSALTIEADILLYGCNVAADAAGVDFVNELSDLTGADIAASINDTGAASLGGDYDLEYSTGAIQTPYALASDFTWQGVLAAGPTAGLDVPADEFINGSISFDVTFDNTGSDIGYGPYVDLIIPVELTGVGNGTLYSAGDTTLNVVATWNDTLNQWESGGNPVTEHPLNVAITIPDGTALGLADGATWNYLVLPFGSFTPAQPELTVTFNGTVDSGAGAIPFTMTDDFVAIGGFQFGEDPLNNPGTDPVVQQSPVAATFTTSTVWRLTKTDDLSENEMATGPNYPVTFTLTLDIATGETIDSVVISDVIPSNIFYIDGTLSAPGGTVTDAPTAGANPANSFAVDYGTVLGVAGNDITITYQGYVPEVLNAASGDDLNITNDSRVDGTYNTVPISDNGSATDNTLTAKSIATQKSNSIQTDNLATGATPTDVVEFTIDFQISDYFEFNSVVLADVMSDGFDFDNTFTPTISFHENGNTIATSDFNVANFSVTENIPGDGTTDISFDISSEVNSRVGFDGTLSGDLVNDAVLTNDTAGTITYRAVILESYRATSGGPGDLSIDLGDPLSNSATITGTIPSSGQTESDGSGSSVTIVDLSGSKSIYAIQGVTSPAEFKITPGETVTYRLTLSLPQQDFENLVLTDFLPLPVFDVDGVGTAMTTTFDNTVSAALPNAGESKFGPSHTMDASIIPTVSIDAAGNTVSFDFGSFDESSSAPATLDILFRITATDQPFADGLFLTNQAGVNHSNSFGALALVTEIVQIELEQPDLTVTKGIVSVESDVSGDVFDPAMVGPSGVTFAAAGTGGAPFTGTITSAGLLANPIDSNVSGLDQGDTARFAIVIENTGSSDAFDVALSDVLPSGLTNVTNLQVYTGDGTLITGGQYSGDLFTTDLSFTDPSGSQGIIDNADDGGASGTNILIIFYDAEVATAQEVATDITNDAQLTDYSAVDGGNNYTTGNTGPWDDTATVTVASPTTAKSIVSTSVNTANNDNTQAVIGETIQYQVVITLPEASLPNMTLVDVLASGNDSNLEFISFDSVVASSGITSSLGAFNTTNITVTESPTDTLTFDFGNVTNANDDNSTADTITLTYTARVENVSANQSGDVVDNSAQLQWNSGADSIAAVSAPDVDVIEPTLRFNNGQTSFTPSSGDANDSVTYTTRLEHTGGSDTDAYDATVSIPFPTEFTTSSFTVVHSTLGDISAQFEITGGNVLQNLGANTFDLADGETLVITVNGSVDSSVEAGDVLTATASAEWTSLDGADANERTGAGGVNDYDTSRSRSFTVDDVSISKTRDGTSITTTTNDANTEAVIGELVTYSVTMTIPESTVNSAELVDTLDSGLEFVALTGVTTTASSISTTIGTGNFDAGNIANFAPSITGDGDATAYEVTFDLGDIVNSDNDVGTETVTFTYTARVMNIDLNDSGDTRNNSAVFNWNNGSNQNSNTSSAANISIIEPDLVVDKSALPTTLDVGDSVTYTITIDHSGSSDTEAYDVTFSDVVPTGLSIISFSATHSASGDISALFEQSGQTIQTIAGQSFDLGFTEDVTVTINASLSAGALTGTTVTNTANTFWTSIDGVDANERDGSGSPAFNNYTDSDGADVTIASPTLAKNIVSTSVNSANNDNTEVAIGETIIYEVTLTFPEGISNAVNIVDTLDTGLSFVSLNSVTALSGGLATGAVTSSIGSFATTSLFNPTVLGQQLTFDMGNITNTDSNNGNLETLTINYTVLVQDIVANEAGDVLGNSAQANWNNGTLFTTNTDNDNDVTVLEPVVTIDKQVSPTSGLDAGDSVTYTITIDNPVIALGTDAFDLTFSDAIPANITIDSFNVTRTTSGDLNSVFETSGNTLQTISGMSFDLAMGEDVLIVVNGTLNASSLTDVSINNTANMTWTSVDGVDANERSGADNDSAAFSTADPSIAKNLVSTSVVSANNANNEVAVGETAIYEVVITLPEGVTNLFEIVDTLDAGLSFVSLNSITVLSGGGASGAVTSSIDSFSNVASFNPTILGQQLTFDLATLSNTDANNANVETVTLNYTVLTQDIPANVDGVTLNNSAVANWDNGSPNSSTTVNAPNITIIESVLQIDKSIDDTTIELNQTVTYTVVLTNPNASSNADAFDIVFTDTTPSNMTLTLASINVVGATIDSNTSSGNNINLVLDQLLIDGTITITYDAVVTSNPSEIGNAANNTGNIVWTTISGTDPNERSDNDNDNANATIVNPDLSIVKSNAVTTVEPGDSLSYNLSASNTGSSGATSVVVTDVVPTGLTFVNGTASVGTVANIAGTITWTIGNLAVAGNETATLNFTVDSPVPPGVTTILNTANITSNNGFYVDPTPLDNTDSETDTLDAEPDYQITKDDGITAIDSDEFTTYTIVVSNVGNQDGTGVTVVDSFPANVLDFISASNGGTYNSSTQEVTWNLGDLDAGDSINLTLTAQAKTVIDAGLDNYTNTVNVTDDGANGPDPTPLNNTDPDTNALLHAPDYFITKDDSASFLSPTLQSTYTIVVTNNGTQDGTGVSVVDSFPPDILTAISATGGGVIDNNVGTVTWTVGNLDVGDTVIYQVLVEMNTVFDFSTLEYTNTATVNDDVVNGLDLGAFTNVASDVNQVILPSGNIDSLLDDGGTDAELYLPYDIRNAYGRDAIAYYFHGRLISMETMRDAANLMGGRSLIHHDSDFGVWGENFFPDLWIQDHIAFEVIDHAERVYVNWGAYALLESTSNYLNGQNEFLQDSINNVIPERVIVESEEPIMHEELDMPGTINVEDVAPYVGLTEQLSSAHDKFDRAQKSVLNIFRDLS